MGNKKANDFWEWFETNHETYKKLPIFRKEDIAYWLNQSEAKVKAFDKNIFAEYYFPFDESTPQIIITTGGNEEFFHRVEELVSNAPVIDGWEIIGFVPPRPIDEGIEELWGHTGINPHNTWIVPYLQFPRDRYIIQVYEDYKGRKIEFEQAVRAVLWNLLGERSATMDISNVKASKYKYITSYEGPDLMNLKELPAYLERHKPSSMYVDELGTLQIKSNL